MARKPSRKWELNSYWLTAGKECGSILSSRLWGGVLRDDTKNGCVKTEQTISLEKLIIFATLPNVSLLILIERPKAYRFRVFLSVSNFFAFF